MPFDILPDEEGGFPNPKPSHATHAGNRYIVWGGIEWSRAPARVKTGFCSGEGRRITVPEVSGPSHVDTRDLMFRTTSQMTFVPHSADKRKALNSARFMPALFRAPTSTSSAASPKFARHSR